MAGLRPLAGTDTRGRSEASGQPSRISPKNREAEIRAARIEIAASVMQPERPVQPISRLSHACGAVEDAEMLDARRKRHATRRAVIEAAINDARRRLRRLQRGRQRGGLRS